MAVRSLGPPTTMSAFGWGRVMRSGARLARMSDALTAEGLREFLFGGVDLRHRMSHGVAAHVPLGGPPRVGRDASRRESERRTATPVPVASDRRAGPTVRYLASTQHPRATPNLLEHD